jgi:HEPN domain-containing protein
MKGNKGRYLNWLAFAEEDLNSAKILLKGQVCFHAQQTAEKSLKAFLKSKGVSLPKTHNLLELIQICKRKSGTFGQLEENCEYLSRFYLPTRYPDAMVGSLPEGLPNMEDATRAVNKAEPVLQFVKKLLT